MPWPWRWASSSPECSYLALPAQSTSREHVPDLIEEISKQMGLIRTSFLRAFICSLLLCWNTSVLWSQKCLYSHLKQHYLFSMKEDRRIEVLSPAQNFSLTAFRPHWYQWLSKCARWTSSTSIIQHLVRTADPQNPPCPGLTASEAQGMGLQRIFL